MESRCRGDSPKSRSDISSPRRAQQAGAQERIGAQERVGAQEWLGAKPAAPTDKYAIETQFQPGWWRRPSLGTVDMFADSRAWEGQSPSGSQPGAPREQRRQRSAQGRGSELVRRHAVFDSDIVIAVRTLPAAECTGRVPTLEVAGPGLRSQPLAYDGVTRRPIYSHVVLCGTALVPTPDFSADLEIVLHEFTQALVRCAAAPCYGGGMHACMCMYDRPWPQGHQTPPASMSV